MGDNWGYLFEFGYSQSGFKEQLSGNENTLKVQNLDFIPIGIQYAFRSDWAKIRPTLLATFGMRLSLSGKVKTQYSTEDVEIEKTLDFPWSIGGGLLLGKHSSLTVSYGGGLSPAITKSSNMKNRQIQIAATYFF